ncbi:MAG: phospho-N-acetylmuramoyl-pentapeptide-transferase [Victivallales bacterium]
MLYYLTNFADHFGPFRLFQYVTFRAGGAAITALLIALIFGPSTVRMLKRLNATAPSRLKGLVPDELLNPEKDKVPSMGGILLIASIAISTIMWSLPLNPLVTVFLVTLLALGAVGFWDDYTKVLGNRNGIPGRLKLLMQIVIAFAAAVYLDSLPETHNLLRQVMVPFLKAPLVENIPAYVAFGFAALVVVACSNAVNLTDGKDGLAVGCSITCILTYGIFAYFCGHKMFAGYLNVPFIPGASEVVVFAAAIMGACIGFLWYNCMPASMFMGDTGSLALGGSIGLIAVLVKQELVLVIVGGVFVVEALSVIIQVISFRLFRKRVFLCTPIHHHFERLGWPESQIVIRFWIISGILALVGLATLKLR